MNWDWIAGFFEGEGYVGWTRSKKVGSTQAEGPQVVIGQKIKEPLEHMQRFLLDQGLKNPKIYLRASPSVKNPIWILDMRRLDDALLFLENIKDKVFQKREATLIVIAHIQRRLALRKIDIDQAMLLRAKGMRWVDIARELHVKYPRLRNLLIANGIPVKRELLTRQIDREGRQRAQLQGLCINCRVPRGDGTRHRCRRCADACNARKRAWRAARTLGTPRTVV